MEKDGAREKMSHYNFTESSNLPKNPVRDIQVPAKFIPLQKMNERVHPISKNVFETWRNSAPPRRGILHTMFVRCNDLVLPTRPQQEAQSQAKAKAEAV